MELKLLKLSRQLPETWEREGTRRVALAARCILEPPSAETESLSYSAMESEPSWSEKAISQQQLNHQLDHHLHCQHSHHAWYWRTAGSIFPKNKQTYIWSNSHLSSVKPKSKRSELESESLQDWESSGRKASQRGRHCLFSKLNSNAGLHQNLSGPSFAAASLLWPFHCSSLSPPTITLDYIMIEFFLEKLSLFIIRISPGTE